MRATSGDYVHDGFFLRVAGGFGGANDKLKGVSRFDGASGTRLDGGIGGLSGGTQLALGGTPIRGLALGGGLETLTLIGSSGSPAKGNSTKYSFDTSQLVIFGAFGDYYLSALRGFHIQATIGLASHVMGQGNPDDVEAGIASPHTAIGFGAALGVGNEWWVAREWSVGVLPRFMIGWASGTDEWGAEYRHRAIGYSLLVTASYH